jgi:SAM-dependent methyltransferase
VNAWNHAETLNFWQHNESDFAGDKTAKVVLEMTKKYVKSPILDVGAGSGALLRLLPETAIGVDLIPQNDRIKRGSIELLPFPAGSFGTVFCTDVLEHLSNESLIRGISEIARVLCPGGSAIVMVPYKENLAASSCYCPRCNSEFHRWGHLQTFDKETMADLFEQEHLAVKMAKTLAVGFISEYKHWKLAKLVMNLVTTKYIQQNLRLLMVLGK